MNHHESLDQFGAKHASWEKQRLAMEKIYRQGATAFLNQTQGIENAFEDSKKCVCCMDEGTAHMDIQGKFELAGSGILYPAASWDERLDKVADLLLEIGVSEITSHDGCGAAALACERDGMGSGDPDAYGARWSRDLRDRLRNKSNQGRDFTYRHIRASEMARPAEFHQARVVWFDATGKFNPAALAHEAPHGFVVDYKHDTARASDEREAEYPFEELKVALKIAFGDHGYGHKFNAISPFVIVVMAEDVNGLEKLKRKVGAFLQELNIADETRQAIRLEGYAMDSLDALRAAA